MEFKITKEGQPLTQREFLLGLKNDPDTMGFLHEILNSSSFAGYFWECEPFNNKSLDQPMRFVLVASSGLQRMQP